LFVYETDVSAKIGGRVAQVSVREGDSIKLGQLLIQIDDSDLRAQLQGAIARVRAAQERLQRVRQQLPVLQAQLQQASLTTEQSSQDSQGQVLEAENAVDQARSNLVEAQASLVQAQARQRRTSQLYAEGAVAAQQLDDETATLANTASVASRYLSQLVSDYGTNSTANNASTSNDSITSNSSAQSNISTVAPTTNSQNQQSSLGSANPNP
jgi:HlyD family secretion protein